MFKRCKNCGLLYFNTEDEICIACIGELEDISILPNIARDLPFNVSVKRGKMTPFIKEAAKNCLHELIRYGWRNQEPEYEKEALQIIERYLLTFVASTLFPNVR